MRFINTEMCVSIFLLLNKKTSGPECSELNYDDDNCQNCTETSFGGTITALEDDTPCQIFGTCMDGTCK